MSVCQPDWSTFNSKRVCEWVSQRWHRACEIPSRALCIASRIAFPVPSPEWRNRLVCVCLSTSKSRRPACIQPATSQLSVVWTNSSSLSLWLKSVNLVTTLSIGYLQKPTYSSQSSYSKQGTVTIWFDSMALTALLHAWVESRMFSPIKDIISSAFFVPILVHLPSIIIFYRSLLLPDLWQTKHTRYDCSIVWE